MQHAAECLDSSLAPTPDFDPLHALKMPQYPICAKKKAPNLACFHLPSTFQSVITNHHNINEQFFRDKLLIQPDEVA